MAFERPFTVRFHEVDFARVVFYPNFFEYAHRVFEDFFAAEVGCPYVEMLSVRNVGYPAVHVEADFKAPLRFGDSGRIAMETAALSRRSATLRYDFWLGESRHARVTVVVASIDLKTFTPVELPSDVRVAFSRHLTSSAES